MTRSVTTQVRARRLMQFAAAHGITCNREDILRRIAAWDAQIAQLQRKHSRLLESESSDARQPSLPWSADRSTWVLTHWPRK